MAAIKDVAKLAGVSVGTVSRYLNQPEALTPESRERVGQAISQLNYRPSRTAKSLRTKRTNMIAFVALEMTNPFYVALYDAVRVACEEHDYVPVIYAGKTEPDFFQRLLAGSVGDFDGYIIGFMDFTDVYEVHNTILPYQPVVVMSGLPMYMSFNNVVSDLFAGGYEAARHIVSMGHKRIAYVSSADNEICPLEKMNGAFKYLQEQDLEVTGEYMFAGMARYSTGYNAAAKFMHLPEPPTAIIAESDILAIGCIKYMNDNGYRVPQDVAVIGYDDIRESSVYSPSVTTIRQPIEEMGRMAVEMLMHKIAHPNSANRQAFFRPSLVVRQSTKADAPVVLEL